MYKKLFKPLIDFCLALLGFVLLLPILIIFILLLVIKIKESPFFYQLRPGYKAKMFKIMKLKTMLNLSDAFGNPLPDHQRIFGLGSLIRQLSIDEIPQLINVMKGDMSLIGPRPLLPEYLHLYNVDQTRRHHVKPGITGWAQVNGRNAISWDNKFKLDVWYVDNISLLLDLKIFWLTVKKVVVREGISSDTSATMEKFKGN